MSKKKETIKKDTLPKASKIAIKKEIQEPGPVPKAIPVESVSFSVRATIPVTSYGNIMPEITIKANTIEEAKAIVMPHIEEMFKTYCEDSRDGRSLKFIPKSNVTVKETVVSPVPTPLAEKTPSPVAPVQVELETPTEKSAPFTKAENAIKAALSVDVLSMIEEQVKVSTKLTDEEKQALYPIILHKRKEI